MVERVRGVGVAVLDGKSRPVRAVGQCHYRASMAGTSPYTPGMDGGADGRSVPRA